MDSTQRLQKLTFRVLANPMQNSTDLYLFGDIDGQRHRAYLGWAPCVEGEHTPLLFSLKPNRDIQGMRELYDAIKWPFEQERLLSSAPPPIVIDLKNFKGLPIESAPKDGTPILIHEPGQGGWIQAHWEDDKKTTGRPAQWYSEHHCDWFSELRPDLWLPLPGGGK